MVNANNDNNNLVTPNNEENKKIKVIKERVMIRIRISVRVSVEHYLRNFTC